MLNELSVPSNQIVFYGHSLGTAIAIELVLSQPCAALILEGAFSSMANLVMLKKQYRFFPIRLILNQRFASIEKISFVNLPILFLHGQRDIIVPYQMSKKLYYIASNPKLLVLLPEAGHNNM